MRDILTTFLFLFLFLKPVENYSQTRLGIVAGISNANIKATDYGPVPDDDRVHFSRLKKMRIGVFSVLKLSSFFSLRPELAYFEKGSGMTRDSSASIGGTAGWTGRYLYKSNITLQYIELPLLLRFSMHLFSLGREKEGRHGFPVSLDLLAGPSVSYLVTTRKYNEVTHTRVFSDSSVYTEYSAEFRRFPDKSINRWTWGGVLTAGLKVKLSPGIELLVEARKTFAAGNINNGYWNRVVAGPGNGSSLVSPAITNANTFTASVGIIVQAGLLKIKPEK